LLAIYPEHADVWRSIVPRGYWKDVQNQRHFFDQLAKKLNIQQPENWDKVTLKTVLSEGGTFVNAYYNSSVVQALQSLYPEHKQVWEDYKHRGYWRDKERQRKFFDELAMKLKIQKPEDWLNVPSKTFMQEEGGSYIKHAYGSFYKGKYFALLGLSITSHSRTLP
jgi:hypothetical protein